MGAAAPPHTKWSPADDLHLKNALQAGATLESLSKAAARFSRRYTVQELQDRWHSILYDPIVSEEASDLMLEYERSLSREIGGTEDNKSPLGKRKSQSIRSRYYAMCKRISNVSQEGEPLDTNFLAAGPGLTNYGNRNEPPFVDYILPDSFHQSTPSVFVGHGLSVDPGALGPNTVLPLEGNIFSTAEGISTPILPVDYGGKEDDINDTFRSSHDVGNPDALNQQIPSLGPQTETAGIIAQLNQFMDCTDPDDVPDTVDEFYIGTFSTLLAGYPNEGEGAIACKSATSIATKAMHRGIICSPEEDKLLSSALSVKPDVPELRNGTICCKLNTEDHAIPDNDDVFLPVCMPTPSLSCLADWEFDKACNPVSSSIMDIPTHQWASRVGTLMMKRDQNVKDNTHLSSQRMNSVFLTPRKVRNEGPHPTSSSFQNHDKTTHGGGLVIEREQIDSKKARITSSSVPTPPNSIQPAMLTMKREETENNQTHISSHSMGSLLMDSNHAVSVLDSNHKLKHIDLQSGMLRNEIVNNQINQLKCTNENENNSGGVYIKEKVIYVDMSEHQNGHPVGSSLESEPIGHNHILDSSSVFDESKPKNVILAVLQNEVFSHEDLDTSEGIKNESEKDPELFRNEECPDDDDYDVPYFSDVEAMILDMAYSPNDEDIDLSETVSRHPNEKLIRTMLRLEQAARASSHRMMQTYGAFAVLYSHHARHIIKKPEVLLGRTAEDVSVDIDLSTERCKNKVSRRQAIIKVNRDGAFALKNLGKASIYVNGREVTPGQSQYLSSSCLIEVRKAAFLFETNPARVKRYIEEEILTTKMKQEPLNP